MEDIELRLYGYNSRITGHDDGAGLAFVIRDAAERIVAVAAGYSWAGMAEIRQMWVDEEHRGHGHARALLAAFIAEARRRGVTRIWVSTFDFQAPGLYEKLGFRRVAELEGWPEGHVHLVMCRQLSDAER
jgi:N-acetylglutamate synthase-like GNAT family acetyltransferase